MAYKQSLVLYSNLKVSLSLEHLSALSCCVQNVFDKEKKSNRVPRQMLSRDMYRVVNSLYKIMLSRQPAQVAKT